MANSILNYHLLTPHLLDLVLYTAGLNLQPTLIGRSL